MRITKAMIRERHGLSVRLARHLVLLHRGADTKAWMPQWMTRPFLFPGGKSRRHGAVAFVFARLEDRGMVKRRSTREHGMVWKLTAKGKLVAEALR